MLFARLKKTPTWEDKQIKDVKHINDYVFMFCFKDGTIKIMDIEPFLDRMSVLSLIFTPVQRMKKYSEVLCTLPEILRSIP